MIHSTLKKSILLILALLLILSFPLAANAAQANFDINKTGSIRIQLRDVHYPDKPIGGTLVLYKVGTIQVVNGNLHYMLTPSFSGSGADLTDINNPALAQALASYAVKEKVIGTTVVADENGYATFTDLTTGLYLVAQIEAVEGYLTVAPFLVSMPMYSAEDGGWLYTIEAAPKVQRPPKDSVDLTIVKKWLDNNKNRPEKLTVTLLKDGEPVETVVLTADNEWKYTWSDLNPYYQWSVKEDVPEGYKVSYSTYNSTVIITNTASWYVPPPDVLIQTGQLNWPVPVLACAGLSLLLIGCILLRRRKQEV